MKLTSTLIATISLLCISACGQEKVETNGVAEAATDAVDEVSAITEDSAGMFATAALIDPNTASVEVIGAIPGIGADLAQQVISGRPYATPTELHAILKDATDETEQKIIYSAMFVVVDLNTGSNADYQLIPSTLSPKHLAHEFEEYRPYSSIEQFSREMSKYVSEKEVAFLRRYVSID